MNDTRQTVLPRFHLALRVADLDESIGFYGKLFGRAPSKVRSDYAKFELAEPPLNFTLNLAGGKRAADLREASGALSHFGIQVADHEALAVARQHADAEGLTGPVEDGVDCCYALQDKFWVTDPDGNRIEYFLVLADDEAATPDVRESEPERETSAEGVGDRHACCT